MYKIILKYSTNINKNYIHIKIFTYYDQEYAEKQLMILKDRYISMGCRIFSLKLYKTEQINVPEQI